MKRTKQTVQSLPLHAALFTSIAARDWELQTSLFDDLHRLEKIVASRGVSFIMIDMPEAGKVVDLGLSLGYYDAEDLPESFGRYRDGKRPFLGCLFSRVFDDTGRLRDDVETSDVADLRQVLYLAKKVRKECSKDAILSEVTAFHRTDTALRLPDLDWSGDYLELPSKRLSLSDSLRSSPDMVSHRDPCPLPLLKGAQRVADNLVSRFKRPFDWRDLRPRHGPGSVADAKMGADKYSFPTWPDKLDRIFPATYFACSREDLLAHLEQTHVHFRKEVPARLKAVPKTLKGPRMIATEPTSHQFIQLGLMKWLRDNLPEPLNQCLDFKDQSPSRELCVIASITGDLATVDLSSASDRLSCWTVERIFRRNHSLLQGLHAARTRWLVNATGIGDPFHILLRKFAPMGNGTTFPVQSIVYAILSIAAILYEKGAGYGNAQIDDAVQEIQVFGDDIILPSFAVPTLALLLEHLQLKVNWRKTHAKGHFRESCGMDAFRGADVTPLYLRDLELGEKPDDIVSWLDVLRNAHRKHYHYLVGEMLSQIPQKVRSLLPTSDANLGCLTLPVVCWDTTSQTRVRYNRKLFRYEVLGLVKETIPVRLKRESDANLVQYWTDSPSPDSLWESGFVVRHRSLMRKRWVPLL